MTPEITQQIKKYESLVAIRESRKNLANHLEHKTITAANQGRKWRYAGTKRVVEKSIGRYDEAISALEPVVEAHRLEVTQAYIEEDRDWQRSLRTLSRIGTPEEIADVRAQYHVFQQQAANNPYINVEPKAQPVKTPEDQPVAAPAASAPVETPKAPNRSTEDPMSIFDVDPLVPAPAPAVAVDPNEPVPDSTTESVRGVEAPKLPEIGLTEHKKQVLESIPLEDDQVVLREEFLKAAYPGVDLKTAASRFTANTHEMQKALKKGGLVIINFDNKGGHSPALYGIRRIEDYEGLVDHETSIPRILRTLNDSQSNVPDSTTEDVQGVEAPKLPDLGFTDHEKTIVELIPHEEGLTVLRSELVESVYPGVDPDRGSDRLAQKLADIQLKLQENGLSVINYSEHPEPSIYGIIKLDEYQGLLDTKRQIPRILSPVSLQSPVEQTPITTQSQIEKPSEAEIEQARELMDKINQLIKQGAELNPDVLNHVKEQYASLLGISESIPAQIPAVETGTKKKSTSLEDFLPELPQEPVARSGEINDQTPVTRVNFEQREEDKRTEEEDYMLKFVFGLQAEAKAQGNQYIDNEAFKAGIKPRREFEEGGVQKIETYSSNDIIRLVIPGLEKLIRESTQPKIKESWDEETAKLFDSILQFAADRKKGIDEVKWVIRRQLKAIGYVIDINSRRIQEKNNV